MGVGKARTAMTAWGLGASATGNDLGSLCNACMRTSFIVRVGAQVDKAIDECGQVYHLRDAILQSFLNVFRVCIFSIVYFVLCMRYFAFCIVLRAHADIVVMRGSENET
jgi:hypothetical protein